jgi:YesN/AraC family two-component response regulator
MPNILFVDDEQRLLDGLARMLRPQRHIWNMQFVLGGKAAIAQLDASRFDIIVCDMRMPDVDGMTVLRHVRDHHPSTVRIALSGQTDLATMTQTVTVVHQFIAKPCDAARLRSVLERVCMLQTLLQQPRLQQVVGHLGDLPVLPRIYDQLCLAFDDPETTMRQIVRIVEQDVAVAARCLQVANSAFFGLRRPVDTLDQAIAYLGMTTLRDLVLSSAVFS